MNSVSWIIKYSNDFNSNTALIICSYGIHTMLVTIFFHPRMVLDRQVSDLTPAFTSKSSSGSLLWIARTFVLGVVGDYVYIPFFTFSFQFSEFEPWCVCTFCTDVIVVRKWSMRLRRRRLSDPGLPKLYHIIFVETAQHAELLSPCDSAAKKVHKNLGIRHWMGEVDSVNYVLAPL